MATPVASASTPLWANVQAISGVSFALFLIPHLANTAIAWLGVSVYDTVQCFLQQFYQHPVGEALLFGSLAVHIATSCWIMWNAGRVSRLWSLLKQGQWFSRSVMVSVSGLLMLVIVVPHVIGTRMHPSVAPHFAGVSFLLQQAPFKYVMFPYFVVFGVSGVVHMGLCLPLAVRRSGGSKPLSDGLRKVWSHPALILGWSSLIVLGVVAMGGGVFPLPDFSSSPFVIEFKKELGL